MSQPNAPLQRLTASDATALDGASGPWLAHDVDGRTVEIRRSSEYETLMKRRQRAAEDASVSTATSDHVTTADALGADGSEVFFGNECFTAPSAERSTTQDGAPDLDGEDVYTE